ncbi:MAG: hypothetical protein WCV73_01615 [Patescibacteria group bacterium]|jgi:hypothetical protein
MDPLIIKVVIGAIWFALGNHYFFDCVPGYLHPDIPWWGPGIIYALFIILAPFTLAIHIAGFLFEISEPSPKPKTAI